MIAPTMGDAGRYLFAGIGPWDGNCDAFLAAPTNAVVIQTLYGEVQH
jgi:hypothetical protein